MPIICKFQNAYVFPSSNYNLSLRYACNLSLNVFTNNLYIVYISYCYNLYCTPMWFDCTKNSKETTDTNKSMQPMIPMIPIKRMIIAYNSSVRQVYVLTKA